VAAALAAALAAAAAMCWVMVAVLLLLVVLAAVRAAGAAAGATARSMQRDTSKGANKPQDACVMVVVAAGHSNAPAMFKSVQTLSADPLSWLLTSCRMFWLLFYPMVVAIRLLPAVLMCRHATWNGRLSDDAD
jgi:hypothetical protein